MAIFPATLGDDVLTGTPGTNDTADYSGAGAASGGITLDLALTYAQATVGSGNDTLTSIENLIATSYADNITATDGGEHNIQLGDGDDWLNFYTNTASVADGGIGDDVLVLNAADMGGLHLRFVNGSTTLSNGGTFQNFETIQFVNGYTTGNMLEIGSGTIDFYFNSNSVSGGNGVDVIIGGYFTPPDGMYDDWGLDTNAGDGNDVIFGTLIGDRIYGGNGDDIIVGLGADSSLGAPGLVFYDDLYGGAGDDTYFITSGSKVYEDANGGTDTVFSDVTFALGGGYVENLILVGTGNIQAGGNSLANILIGNSGNNVLNGAANADTMAGSLGNDIYFVDNIGDVVTELAGEGMDTIYSTIAWSLYTQPGGQYIENLFLQGSSHINATGNAANNLLVGNAGNNVLNGYLGADTMNGGAGNDAFIVDNAGDVVIEDPNGGTDTIYSSLTWTVGNNVENLFLTGATAINAFGNAADNLLVGNDAANVLNGGLGADTMNGGAGGDVYYIDNVGDVVIEASNGGADKINSTVSYSLSGLYVENLTLLGTANINATGNNQNNVLLGNSGNNLLDGRVGADTLTGNAGADIFRFQVGSGADRITDFSAGQGDTIDLHAYNAQSTAIITQVGADTHIDLGGGNIITVANTTYNDSAFLSHIVW